MSSLLSSSLSSTSQLSKAMKTLCSMAAARWIEDDTIEYEEAVFNLANAICDTDGSEWKMININSHVFACFCIRSPNKKTTASYTKKQGVQDEEQDVKSALVSLLEEAWEYFDQHNIPRLHRQIILVNQDFGTTLSLSSSSLTKIIGEDIESFLNDNKFIRRAIEVWTIEELQYDIACHELVPKHIIIRDENMVQQIMKKYSLTSKQQLPLIMITDPMSRYLKLRPGDIVKITRISNTVGQYDVYRCCAR